MDVCNLTAKVCKSKCPPGVHCSWSSEKHCKSEKHSEKHCSWSSEKLCPLAMLNVRHPPVASMPCSAARWPPYVASVQCTGVATAVLRTLLWARLGSRRRPGPPRDAGGREPREAHTTPAPRGRAREGRWVERATGQPRWWGFAASAAAVPSPLGAAAGSGAWGRRRRSWPQPWPRPSSGRWGRQSWRGRRCRRSPG